MIGRTTEPGDPVDADTIYRRAIVIDGSIAPNLDAAHIARMRASGVTAVNWTVPRPFADIHAALSEISAALSLIQANEQDLLLIRSVDDLRRAKELDKVGVIFGPQNARPCEGGLDLFQVFHTLGIRIMQLTYNERNVYGDGATEPADAGISLLGKAAIAEMNRLGILIDLSHCGDRTTRDAIDASSDPVVFTHANCRALLASPRNKTDDHIRAIAARGGLIGLTLWSPMLAFDRRPGLDDFLRHLSYAIDLVGIDHVAIGTDHSEGVDRERWEREFGRGGKYPTVTDHLGGWYGYDTRFAQDGSSVTDFPGIARAIAGLGLSEVDLIKVLGGNFIRVFDQVWGSSTSNE